MNRLALATAMAIVLSVPRAAASQTWKADNGNGTFSNPLFYDEFSDPDLIRVGDDFYLTGTTMHAMPGLPVLHSRDLVNWEFLSYAMDRLDLGPAYRLEGGKDIYGKGIWAPSFRYHKGTFHIFSNVNGQTTQHFTATNPRGPWTRTAMKRSLHDLSVLFDDDGTVYVVWGYQDIHIAQLDSTLTDIVPGSEHVLFAKDAGMGEGSHFYRIGGKYYITSAWYAGRMRLAAARADHPEGPYEVNREISADETFGLREGHRVAGNGNAPEIVVTGGNPTGRGHMSMHQGGIVLTPAGEWWGFSMMDANSIGRLTALSPVTWKDGWPYFGLAGNLGRTPRTWVKPKTAAPGAPSAPYVRSDAFSGATLQLVLDGAAAFTVVDRGLGRVALRAGNGFVSIAPTSDRTSGVSLRATRPGDAETFQWMETLYGDVVLMSVVTHRYLRLEPDGRLTSDSRGPEPDPNDGTALAWHDTRTPKARMPNGH